MTELIETRIPSTEEPEEEPEELNDTQRKRPHIARFTTRLPIAVFRPTETLTKSSPHAHILRSVVVALSHNGTVKLRLNTLTHNHLNACV